jgi:hypothetical protein
LFEVLTTRKKLNASDIKFGGKFRYVARGESNNGVKGYIDENPAYLNDANTISFGQDTATVFYQDEPYFTGDKIKVIKPKPQTKLNKNTALFIVPAIKKSFSNFSWGRNSFNVSILKNTVIKLPTISKGTPDYAFMEGFIAELEAERIAELEAYLKAAGLKDYHLTPQEHAIIEKLNQVQWGEFRLRELFGKATRGKRLKSADRIPGNLPFVTAGENDAGISATIGNDVTVFSANTITIDMFGSAKYRSYQYGADDHVAVVHADHLPPNVVIFVTAAIHKSSHNGQFDYSRNFYASDADELTIKLPVTPDGEPDYAFMEGFIQALQKVVIAGVVDYTNRRIEAHRKVVFDV